MLSASTRPATARVQPARTNNQPSKKSGAAAREKRVLMGLSLDLVAQRCKKLDLFQLSRYERGLLEISDEQRASVDEVLRAEMTRRAERMAQLMSD